MNDDTVQLREYAASGSESAFAAIVQRYLPLVYGAALRRLGGDTHRAQDVAQMTFATLARNARKLAAHPDLAGWLFTTARFLASKTVRGEQRRRSREQQARLADELMSTDVSPDVGASLIAVLDEALMDLRQLDRHVILLRFHRGLRLAEIGREVGGSENAIQKRIDRALDQLKDKLARRGITSTATALTVAFEQQAAVAIPTGLAAACGAVALIGTASMPAAAGLFVLSKLQVGLAATAIVAASAGLAWEVQENINLRRQQRADSVATHTVTNQLRGNVAALTQRVVAAEADAVALEKALQAATPVAPAPAARTRMLTDAQEQANAAMARATKLIQAGDYEGALGEYLALYRTLAGRHGMPDQQIVMGSIASFGRKYPRAIAALRELRDEAMVKLQAKPADHDLVNEIALLNERLGEGDRSMALYDSLPVGDPGRQAVGVIAHSSFVAARRYADAFVGKSFGSMMRELDMGIRTAERTTNQSSAGHREFVVKQTVSNIEVMTGVGKLEEARALTDRLLAFDGSESTRKAVDEHVQRASAKP